MLLGLYTYVGKLIIAGCWKEEEKEVVGPSNQWANHQQVGAWYHDAEFQKQASPEQGPCTGYDDIITAHGGVSSMNEP